MVAKEGRSISGYFHKRLKRQAPAAEKNWQFQLEALLTHSPKQVKWAKWIQLLTIYFWWVTLGRQLIKSRNGEYSWLIPYANLTKDPTYHPYTPTIFILINGPRRDANWAYFCILGLIRWLEASVQQDHACSFSKLIVMEVSMSFPSLRLKLLQTTIYLRDFGFLTSFPYNTRTLSLNVLTCNILLN